ncbi:sigma-70 family RNA polymerase sigma factor [Streptomyces lunaelactis]|nr:sigma-70 family RNA polymerase sigma factor [Streptomyces lunaelactis]
MANEHDEPPSDAGLTDFLRNPGSGASVEELYRRHRSAVLSYAYVCCRDPHTAEDLTSDVFARALQAVRSGSGPKAAWRPYLLTIVRRTAADWAGTARRTELSPEFERWLANLPESPESESREARMLLLEDSSLVLRAFRSLPERWQTVLWHTGVEGEPARSVGHLLGVGESGVNSIASRAREGLRETCLAALADHAGTDECRRYSPMLGAVVRRTGRRSTEDFDRHLSECRRCRSALIELTDLNEEPSSVLSAAVLLWGSRAYVAARMTEAGVRAAGAARASGTPRRGISADWDTGWRSWATGSPLRSGAVAGGIVAAVGLAVLALPMRSDGPGTGPSSAHAEAVRTRTVHADPPPVTVTARPSPPTSSRPAEASAAAPSRTASAGPSAPHGARLGTVTWSGTLRNAGLVRRDRRHDGRPELVRRQRGSALGNRVVRAGTGPQPAAQRRHRRVRQLPCGNPQHGISRRFRRRNAPLPRGWRRTAFPVCPLLGSLRRRERRQLRRARRARQHKPMGRAATRHAGPVGMERPTRDRRPRRAHIRLLLQLTASLLRRRRHGQVGPSPIRSCQLGDIRIDSVERHRSPVPQRSPHTSS